MKRAIVYKRMSKYFVHASSRTTEGVWILTEPWLSADATVNDERLGEIIQAALAGSVSGIPHPTEWSGLLDPLLRLAGVNSWAKFAEAAASAEIETNDGTISILPTKNLGVEGGFEPLPSRIVTVDSEATRELGATVREQL